MHDNILSRILGQGLRYRKNFDHMKESFESLTVAETTGLRNNLSYLDTIVTMAFILLRDVLIVESVILLNMQNVFVRMTES